MQPHTKKEVSLSWITWRKKVQSSTCAYRCRSPAILRGKCGNPYMIFFLYNVSLVCNNILAECRFTGNEDLLKASMSFLWIVDEKLLLQLLFAWETLPFGHMPQKQQGLKLKIGIHLLMASTEWVQSDDWGLLCNTQWTSYMKHLWALRSKESNTLPVEGLFAQL